MISTFSIWISVSQAAKMAKNFYQLSAELLNGKKVQMSAYKGKVVLVENVASL